MPLLHEENAESLSILEKRAALYRICCVKGHLNRNRQENRSEKISLTWLGLLRSSFRISLRCSSPITPKCEDVLPCGNRPDIFSPSPLRITCGQTWWFRPLT